jgi:hypothetical protein
MRILLCPIVVPLACAGLSACQYSGTVNGPGTITVTPPLTIPALPPGSPGAPSPPGVGTRPSGKPVDGEYAGSGTTLTNPGQRCKNTIKITRWMVQGDEVSYLGFRGTVAPDGGLKMQYRDAYIIGSYRDSHFEGRFWRPQPACTYAMSVDPVAPKPVSPSATQ